MQSEKPSENTDEQTDLTRRDFVKQSAVLGSLSAAWYSTAMRTDAKVEASEFGSGMPYPYFEPPE